MSRDADTYDFFVSYARADNAGGWISGFVEGILAEHKAFSGGRELTCFFDKEEIRNGHDWRHRIGHGVAESRVFLAFVSPRYFASEWCRREWRAWIDTEIAKHVFSDGAMQVYIVEVPGFEGDSAVRSVSEGIAKLCEMPEPFDAFLDDASPVIEQLRRRQFEFVCPFYSGGMEALRSEDLRRVLEALAKDLDTRTALVRQAAESANTVPPYNRNFSGRVEELLALRDRLKNDGAGVVCGVHGLGGIGKTELAFTYAHAFAGVYPGGRLLVPCEGKADLREAALSLDGFADFRALISDEDRKTPAKLFDAILACLARRIDEKGSILLVLDNVSSQALMTKRETDELTMLGPKLHLLMTTRLAPPVGGNWLPLSELPEADAMVLLEKYRPFAGTAEREAGLRIVRRLGGFAMAVELVGAWLAAHPEGASYAGTAETIGLEDLEAIAGDESTELRRHNHERRLTAVLEPVLAGLSDVERTVLQFAAFLPADTVALPWLKTLVETGVPGAFRPSGLIADPWREVCWRLTRLTLFSRAGEDAWRVRVHRLVQDVVKRRMTAQGVVEFQQAVEGFVRERDAELENTTRWESVRWELDALDALANLWAETRHASAAWLLNQAAVRWHNVAQWARAEPLMRRALSINEVSYGENHPNVAINLNNLAALLLATNRLSEAEPLMRRALAIDEASYGKDHPNVAIDLNNLAQLLKGTNRLSEAEPLMRRALAIDEASYGKDHPQVAIRLNNLAHLLNSTNRLSEAEPLMRRALSIDEASYGSDHPKVATRLNNLAQLLQATDRLSEAERPMRRALAIDEASYGKDHPRVAVDLNNLALLFNATNRLSEAEPLMRRALAIDEASYGKDHPDLASDLNNLAQLLQAANRQAEAEPLMRRHLEIFLLFTRRTQHEHPHLRDAVMNYAILLNTMNLPHSEIVEKLAALGPEPVAIFRQQIDQSNG